jgi:hypothetical protein
LTSQPILQQQQKGRYIVKAYGSLSWLLCLGALLAGQQVLADDLAEIRKIVGDCRVRLEHKSSTTAGKDNVPPLRHDSWSLAGTEGTTIQYSRYLNQPPHYTGQHPSLPNGDMGIGFGGWAFGNWYGGNAIRVLINGADVFAQKPATRIETGDGDSHRVRMVWELDNGGELALNFALPEDGHAIYARLEIVPGKLLVKSIQLHLSCYPGGFGPAYKLPSYRCVATSKGEWSIPPDFKADLKNPYPKPPFQEGEDWIFYTDKLQSAGSLGLLLRKEQRPSGDVNMSNYGQGTELNYPAGTRQIDLAFFAFDTENLPSRQWFMSNLDRERAQLTSVWSWSASDKK